MAHDTPAARPARQPRPDESMSLLVELMDRPLDPSYAAAAAARDGAPPRRPWNTPTVAAAAVLIGAVFATSASTFTGGWQGREGSRADLVSRIQDREAAARDHAARVVALRQDLRDLDADALDATGGDTAAVDDLRQAAGEVGVHGPGIRITLDDADDTLPAPGGGPRGGVPEEGGRIVYRDLSNITNDLWASGAEAVSVNGHRLTSTSAIRFAGQAIIVGFRPLARPYVIEAVIGDAERSTFLTGAGGAYLADLRTAYAVRADAEPQESLTVPPAESVTLRHARVAHDRPGAPTTAETDASANDDTKEKR